MGKVRCETMCVEYLFSIVPHLAQLGFFADVSNFAGTGGNGFGGKSKIQSTVTDANSISANTSTF